MRPLVIAAIGLLVSGCSWHDPRNPVAPTTVSPNAPTGSGAGPSFPETTSIAIGDRVEGTVNPNDPHCWPNWDASAVCRMYSVVAKEAGTLTATLSWSAGEPMDVLIFPERGSPVWAESSKPKTTVAAGQVVALLVMSYRAPQDFVLETSFQP